MSSKFDLVIVGGGCVGMAAAYYALKMNRSVCILQKRPMGQGSGFWSQAFFTTQNRMQYNQEYLSKFVKAANNEWRTVEQELGKGKAFLYRQGALWFGDNTLNTTVGSIRAACQSFDIINHNLLKGEKRLDSLYIDTIMQESPEYMKAFNPSKANQWDEWSSLYQPEGGSVDMKASYDAFYLYIKSHSERAAIYDNSEVIKHETLESQFRHRFITSSSKVVESRSVLICTGVFTPHFLKNVMNYPHLVDHNFKDGDRNREYNIQEYVSSYLKVQQGYENFYSRIPTFVNFIKEDYNKRESTTYGFPCHVWDNLKGGCFIKLGTMNTKRLESQDQEINYLKSMSLNQLKIDDRRVQSSVEYAGKRMRGVDAKNPLNKHFPYPMIFYQGRETLLDYMQRKDESIVVQSGGWLSSQYPLLAKTAVQMLFEPNKIRKEKSEQTVIGSFLNRTRFPLKPYVIDRINALNQYYPKDGKFNTVVIGAGCAGIYSAYRLNKAKNQNIGVFDLSERISGGLKSFQIRGTSTPLQLEQMRYIPDKHVLLSEVIHHLGIPNIPFPVEGERAQSLFRKSSLKNDFSPIMLTQGKKKVVARPMESCRMKGQLLGMSAYQIICFSLYQILTAPENIGILAQIFLEKTKEDIAVQRERANCRGEIVHVEDIYYRNFKNYVYQEKQNPLSYHINLTLQQWNRMRQLLVFRFPYQVKDQDIYCEQERVEINQLYPLYKFGFQNVIESQFGHEAYQFTAQQNGYYSHTSNASYLDQVMIYLLDYGDVSYRTLAGGFDNINYAMANELVDEQRGLATNDGGIYLGHKLVNIEKLDNSYLLTFHKKDDNAPVPLEDPFKCQLLSGVKKSKLYNLIHKDLGTPIPLPGKPGFSSIQFVADSLILAMPKKAIQLLYNQIDLLRQPISTYESLYKQDRRHYESLFNLPHLKDEVRRVKRFTPLTFDEKEERKRLLRKQEIRYRDPLVAQQLSPNQTKKLIQLSERHFYDKVISILPFDMKYQQQKLKNFTEDEPIIPKNLYGLTETTEAMPAMKMIMNFTKNWWDPIQRINECLKKPYKQNNITKTIEEIRTTSMQDLSVRQTLHLSLGQDNILMCTYNDRTITDFWITLHNNFQKEWTPISATQKETSSTQKEMRSTVLRQIIAIPPHQNIFPAKEVLVKEVLQQLSRIYNMQVKEQWLKECVYQFWGNDEFGVGCHRFYSGYYIPSLMQCMRRPWKDEQIHFVGEGYSNSSGWVEGAFQTSQLLLQKEFGLKPLVKDYYAGY